MPLAYKWELYILNDPTRRQPLNSGRVKNSSKFIKERQKKGWTLSDDVAGATHYILTRRDERIYLEKKPSEFN